jgi:hypothetical protein
LVSALATCCHSSIVVSHSFPPIFVLINSWYGWSKQWEALWSGWLFGERWRHDKLCCAAGCSKLQNHSAVMDLTICHFCCQIHIPWFQALLWLAQHRFYSKHFKTLVFSICWNFPRTYGKLRHEFHGTYQPWL